MELRAITVAALAGLAGIATGIGCGGAAAPGTRSPAATVEVVVVGDGAPISDAFVLADVPSRSDESPAAFTGPSGHATLEGPAGPWRIRAVGPQLPDPADPLCSWPWTAGAVVIHTKPGVTTRLTVDLEDPRTRCD